LQLPPFILAHTQTHFALEWPSSSAYREVREERRRMRINFKPAKNVTRTHEKRRDDDGIVCDQIPFGKRCVEQEKPFLRQNAILTPFALSDPFVGDDGRRHFTERYTAIKMETYDRKYFTFYYCWL
jgi:hypothetical protein